MPGIQAVLSFRNKGAFVYISHSRYCIISCKVNGPELLDGLPRQCTAIVFAGYARQMLIFHLFVSKALNKRKQRCRLRCFAFT